MEIKPFLWQVAEKLAERFGNNLFRIAIVFPNRRQSVYFREYLLQRIVPPALLPEMLTIEELVKRSSDYALADPVRQSFALYQSYLDEHKNSGNPAEPMGFEDFYRMAQTLLSDLNETDSYCIQVEKLFSLIADYKEIDHQFTELTDEQRHFLKSFWESVNLGDVYQERFAELWRQIPKWYKGMHQKLEHEGYATLGNMYRHLAKPDAGLPDAGWLHIAFVGFNAFNGAEERIIKHWQDQGLASLYFDTDNYYLSNYQHEAGYFFRRNFEIVGLKNEMPIGAFIPKANDPDEFHKQVVITRVDGQLAQAKMVGEWIKNLPKDLAIGKAAILLADEKLLIPVLQSIPPESGNDINITMGYPLSQSPLFSLLELFFQTQEILEGKKAGSGSVPWELAIQWIHHPLNDWKAEEKAKLRTNIIGNGMNWVTVSTLLKENSYGNWLFTPLPNRNNLFTWLRNLLQDMAKSNLINSDQLLKGLLSGLYDALHTIEPLYKSFQQELSFSFLKSMLLTPLSSVTIPFEAASTAGIQIMGLLESRGLDFDHILLLGAGEGTLPRVAAAKTFIPFNLRKAFGLSTLENQDAIFGYVFYRLLHRSRQIHGVFNGLVTENSSGEVSRFIQQLEFESGIPVIWTDWQLPVKATSKSLISIEKTEDVMRILSKYYNPEKPSGISPSAINRYLSCRLQFFLYYIAGIKPPDKMQTEMDPAMFGSAVHILLEHLYEQWLSENKEAEITTEAIDQMIAWLPEKLEEAIREAWNKGQTASHSFALKGFATVVADVVIYFTKGFLEYDRKRVPFKVHETEVTFKYPIQVPTSGGSKTLFLTGNIDRVDEKDGVVRMVDYKTGGDQVDFHSLEELFKVHGEKLNKGVLQTLLYAFMFNKTKPEYKSFEPALVVLRKLKTDREERVQLREKSTKMDVNASQMSHFLPLIEEGLIGLLAELLNPDIPFDQTEDLKTCGYCDYREICGR